MDNLIKLKKKCNDLLIRINDGERYFNTKNPDPNSKEFKSATALYLDYVDQRNILLERIEITQEKKVSDKELLKGFEGIK